MHNKVIAKVSSVKTWIAKKEGEERVVGFSRPDASSRLVAACGVRYRGGVVVEFVALEEDLAIGVHRGALRGGGGGGAGGESDPELRFGRRSDAEEQELSRVGAPCRNLAHIRRI